jgi:hypothetical protein
MLDEHDDAGRGKVDAIRRIVLTLRRGPRESAAVVAAVLLLGADHYLVDLLAKSRLGARAAHQASWLITVAAGLLLLYALVRIWRQAAPLPVGAPVPPSPVRGPMAFTEKHGELFRRLGRQGELAKLLGLVRDDQVPLVVLEGESGAGKTSLLRAGLSDALAGTDQRYVYWGATRHDPAGRLARAINLAAETLGGADRSWSLATPSEACERARCRLVVVIDQLEQLDPEDAAHQGVFDLLRRALRAPPPHYLKLVVAFRRDYYPTWRDFERELEDDGVPGRARVPTHDVSLRLFSEAAAAQVLPTLTDAAGFRVSEALVTAVLRSVRNADGRVSPLDIGIAMMVLSERAAVARDRELDMGDYRMAGGLEGLLAEYLGSKLERFDRAEQQAVLAALLALGDLESGRRIAEGQPFGALAAAASWPSDRLRRAFDYLADPSVRVLERLSDEEPPRYRLPHDRIVPALRRLSGKVLADVDEARASFERAFRTWVERERRRRYLLAGRELRQVERCRAQIPHPTRG